MRGRRIGHSSNKNHHRKEVEVKVISGPSFVDQAKKKIRAWLRRCYASCVKGSPPEACDEVEDLFMVLKVSKKCQLQLYHVFHDLAQNEVPNILRTPTEVNAESIYELILDRQKWVKKLLKCLLALGGCEEEKIDWNAFLYILLRFCALNRVELCQTLFMIILKDQKSKVLHYLSMQQLIEFYAFYARCPVTSFNTRAIDFTRFPHHRYYVEDFTEVVQRFTVLLNPIIHLQRSLQEFLPSMSFWDNHSRTEVVCRKITREYFNMKKSRCYLWGEPPFRETCELLAPEALGFEPLNTEQWELRTYDLHERVGAMTEEVASRNGLVAPPGFQYRSLRQYSVWGEQPSPEETEEMMLKDNENTYMTSAGYITQHLDPLAHENKEDETESSDEDEDGKKKKKKKKKVKKTAEKVFDPLEEIIGNPMQYPEELAELGACLDEEYNAPIDILPPSWMKVATIAPAPRILGPDRPLRPNRAKPRSRHPWNQTQNSWS